MMKFSVAMVLVGFLAACSTTKPRDPASTGQDALGADPSANARMIEIKTKLIAGFEKGFKRPLTNEERDSVVSFSTSAGLLGNQLYTQTASNDLNGNPTVTTYLFCLGGKAGFALKAAAHLCLDPEGRTYFLGGLGGGLVSMGAAVTAVMVKYVGPPDSIRGTYNGISVGNPTYFVTAATKTLFRVLGAEMYYMQAEQSTATILVGGLSVGPIWDLSVMKFIIM